MEKLVWKGIEITVEKTPNGHRATAVIPTKTGAFVYSKEAVVPPELRDALFSYLRAYAPDLPSVVSGDVFGDIGKAISQMTKSKAFSDVTSTIADVAQNPLFSMALGAVAGPGAIPIAQAIGGGARAAHSLASRARRGDPRARRAVGDIARRARTGDPKAIRAAQLVREAAQQAPRLDDDATSALGGTLRGALGELASFVPQQADAGQYAAMVAQYAQAAAVSGYDVIAGCAGNPACVGCKGAPVAHPPHQFDPAVSGGVYRAAAAMAGCCV